LEKVHFQFVRVLDMQVTDNEMTFKHHIYKILTLDVREIRREPISFTCGAGQTEFVRHARWKV